jgi:hypothetical protein
VLAKRYFEYGEVASLTHFFAVAKGDEDTQIVYNSTSSGLNAHLWFTWFALATINTMLRALEPGTYMGDIDIGEFFLNFILQARCSYLAGVYLKTYIEQLGGEPHHWARWGRCVMIFRPSPYKTTQAIGWDKEVTMGDQLDDKNVFRWAEVIMNLPGSVLYDPMLQWVSKVRKKDGRVDVDLFIYIDDSRPTAPSEQECWQAARKAVSTLNSMGLQEAPRKYRPESMTRGPWAGYMAYTNYGEVHVLIAKKKWDKGKGIIRDLMLRTKQSRWLDHNELERRRGFLIYLYRTYPPMTPFLLGLHQTIDGWRSFRHEVGWKMQQAEIMAEKGDEDVADVEEDNPGQNDPLFW